MSEDYIYDTVEFNEFLQMMAKQQDLTHSADAVAEAFRFKSIQGKINFWIHKLNFPIFYGNDDVQGYGQMMRLP